MQKTKNNPKEQTNNKPTTNQNQKTPRSAPRSTFQK